jgi:hypothetical protein
VTRWQPQHALTSYRRESGAFRQAAQRLSGRGTNLDFYTSGSGRGDEQGRILPGQRDRVQLAVLAYETGLVRPGSAPAA